MSATAAFFIFLAILITLSIVFNFWIWLVVAAAIFIGLGVFLNYIDYGGSRRIRYENVPRSGGFASGVGQTPRRREREIRDRIEDEWNRQSGFGDSEDLR